MFKHRAIPKIQYNLVMFYLNPVTAIEYMKFIAMTIIVSMVQF